MKMTKSKKYLAGMLFAACLAASAVGVSTIKEVSADPQVTSPYSTLALEDGASVRIADEYKDAGIRFHLTLSKNEYETLTDETKSPYTDVSFGILIAPEDYLIEGKELTAANVFGIGGEKIYGWAERNADGTWQDYDEDSGLVEIVNFNTKTMPFEDGEYSFYGALVDIINESNANNVSREFRGVGYMLYTEGGEEKVELVGDDDNVRSIAYVTQKALEAGTIKDADDAERMEDFYVDGVESEATVNHYKLNANGAYVLEATATSGKMQIGEQYTTTKNSYAGYIFDADSSTVSGTVYANEKTTLNLYYNPTDNVLPELSDWAVMLGGYNQGYDSAIDYTPEFTSDNVLLTNKGTTDAPKWLVSNLNDPTNLFKGKQAQLVGHEEENLIYKDKEVAFSFSMPANESRLPIFIGANLSYLTKADLQALLAEGYTKLSFSFVHSYSSATVQRAGYWLLDLDKVKASLNTDSPLGLRLTETTVIGTTSCTKGRLNLNAFTWTSYSGNNNTTNAQQWVDVEYEVADLIACYDVLFAGEDYWTLAIPFGDVGAYNYSAEWNERDVSRCYVSNMSFVKAVDIDDFTNVLPNLNDWAVMLGGYNQGYDSVIDYTPEFTSDNVLLTNKGTADAPKWLVSNLNDPTNLFKGKQAQLVGHEEENLIYKDKEVAFSFSMPANESRLPIFIGAGLSHVTKEGLQALLDLGYTKLSFSFVHSYSSATVQRAGYWLLDLNKVKASLNTDSPLGLRLTEDTVIGTTSCTKGRLNLNAFTWTSYSGNNNTTNAQQWVDVNYEIADLLACYDVLFAGEDYWTLAIPFGDVGAYNYSAEWNERDVSRCYVSNMSFVK